MLKLEKLNALADEIISRNTLSKELVNEYTLLFYELVKNDDAPWREKMLPFYLNNKFRSKEIELDKCSDSWHCFLSFQRIIEESMDQCRKNNDWSNYVDRYMLISKSNLENFKNRIINPLSKLLKAENFQEHLDYVI